VVEIRKTASVLEVTADVGFPLVSVVTSGAADDLGLEVGVEIMASVKATAVVIVPA
jgi:molybdopterin-binding protein